MKLSKKDIKHLAAILDYLGYEEFKYFANMVEDKEDVSNDLWLDIRAMYIALGYTEFYGMPLDALDGSVSAWGLKEAAYSAASEAESRPSTN
jgi:hypothetical protein